MRDYILVIDEGTTGTRAIIYDKQFNMLNARYAEITRYTPSNDMVEEDFLEIYDKSVEMCKLAMADLNLTAEDIFCIGIANQRNTECLWDKYTGVPLRRGIVWQDKRTSTLLEQEKKKSYMIEAAERCSGHYETSSAHIVLKWIMENDSETRSAILEGRAMYGTVDTWLVWKLTRGLVYATSYSNASSLGAYDYVKNDWSQELLNGAGISVEMMPQILDETGDYGYTEVFGAPIPITCVAGDQQASLFGQGCWEKGTAKCTNGTGTFMDVNIGDKYMMPCAGLATKVAWSINGNRQYLYEGELSVTGSAIQWLKDNLGIIGSSKESYDLAVSVPDSNGVVFVVTMSGACAPNYDPYARGSIFGISIGTKKEHIVRATLEGIAFGIADVFKVVEEACGICMKSIKIDGGASNNNFLAQTMADYIRCDIYRSYVAAQSTALGAAQLSVIGAGLYTMETLPRLNTEADIFVPLMEESVSITARKRYKEAVARSMQWLKDL